MIELEQIIEPEEPHSLEDWLGTEFSSSWSFGIHTDTDDVQHVHGYHVCWN